MTYQVSQLKEDLSRKLHGTSLRKLSDVNGLINEAARTVLSEIDFKETRRTYQMTNPIYNDIYDYVLPTDLKDDKIIDIYQFLGNSIANRNVRIGSADFDMNKKTGTFNIKYESGQRWLRLAKSVSGEGNTISEMDEVGDWVDSHGASDVTLDTIKYISGSSISFIATSSDNTVGIVNYNLPSVDLSGSMGDGSFFLYLFIPSVSNDVSSIRLLLGSSLFNYWIMNASSANGGISFKEGWNLVKLDWVLSDKYGNPDASNVSYAEILVNRSEGTDEAEPFRIDSFVYRTGSDYLVDYYSSFLFGEYSTGEWKELAESDDDVINLGITSYNILLAKCEELAAQELQGEDSAFDSSVAEKKYIQARDKYKRENKSEYKKKRLTYYNV